MSTKSMAMLRKIFDAAVNSPIDAAFGFILPASDKTIERYNKRFALSSTFGGVAVGAGVLMASPELSVIGAFYPACGYLWFAAQGRAVRHALNAQPQ